MCDEGPAVAVRDHAGARVRHAAPRCSATPSSTARCPGGQAEFLRVPQAQYGPIKVPEGPPDDRFVYLSDVLPTAWQAVEYADVPQGETLLVLGLGPIGEMCTRIAQHRGAGQVIGVDLVPERLARASAHGVDDARPRRRRRPAGGGARAHRRPRPDLGDRRGRDGGARLAGRQARPPAGGFLPDAVAAAGDPDGRRSTGSRALHMAIELVQRGGTDLALRRLRRRDQPDAADPDVRQADQRADGPGQRQALDRRHPAAALGRRRPARRRRLRHASRCRSTRRRAPTRSSRRSRTARSRSCCSRRRAAREGRSRTHAAGGTRSGCGR